MWLFSSLILVYLSLNTLLIASPKFLYLIFLYRSALSISLNFHCDFTFEYSYLLYMLYMYFIYIYISNIHGVLKYLCYNTLIASCLRLQTVCPGSLRYAETRLLVRTCFGKRRCSSLPPSPSPRQGPVPDFQLPLPVFLCLQTFFHGHGLC